MIFCMRRLPPLSGKAPMDPDFPQASQRLQATVSGQAKLLTTLRRSLKSPGSAAGAAGAGAEENLGFARLDHDRESRKGYPEVVYGEGKTLPQIDAIAGRILKRSGRILITRVGPEVFAHLRTRHAGLRYHPEARAVYHEGAALPASPRALPPARGHVLVVCAGTSDIPVAEEAALTARLLGCRVKTLHDVGVAGLHRLLKRLPDLRRASVIIAVAGMEGALPSVIAGLVDKPVIGVPTSVGYGASLKGLAALLALLNSCAAGLTVVNIDNGFGAGFAAAQILRLAGAAKPAAQGKRAPAAPKSGKTRPAPRILPRTPRIPRTRR
jgi:NCAIR mutase (PurE)-related protein